MWALIAKGLVAAASLGIASGILSPLNLVLAYLFFRPLVQAFAFKQFQIAGQPIGLPLTALVIVVAAFMLLRPRWQMRTGHDGAFIAVLFLSLVSFSVTLDYRDSFEGLSKLLTGWMLFLVTYNAVRSDTDARRLVDVVILSALIPLAVGFYQELTGQYGIVYDTYTLRVNSVFGVGNAYGIYLSLITAAIAMRLLITASTTGRLLLLAVLGAVVVSEILALNRGTWIALTLALLFATSRYWRRVNKTFVTLLTVAVLVGFADTIRERFEDLETGNQYTGHNTFEGRVLYWKMVVPLILERPVIGHGIGTSAKLALQSFGDTVHAHNDFITLALEIGIPGALAYLAFLAGLCWYFYSRPPSSAVWRANFPILMMVSYFLIISVFQNIIYNLVNFPLFMALVALGLRLNRHSTDARRQEAPSP